MNKSIKLIFNYFLAPAFFVILSWSLYSQISRQPDLQLRWQEIKGIWQHSIFWVVIVLMFVNWGIEARKWQLLMAPLEAFTFKKAFKSVLAGCSVTMLTPNRIGEYGGRIIYVEEKNRLQAISLTILGSMSQLLVTLLMGTAGLFIIKFFKSAGNSELVGVNGLAGELLIILSTSFTVILVLLYLRIKWLVHILERFSFLNKMVRHIKILDVFSGKQLLRILFLSFLRYMVFILQYVLLLNLVEIEVSIIVSFWLLTIFYLIMAVAPTIGFIELPVRAAASVELFKLYSSNILGIQAAALGIWIINLVVPAIIGSLLIFGIKILKDK